MTVARQIEILTKKFESGQNEFVLKNNSSQRSEIWQMFQQIYDLEGNKVMCTEPGKENLGFVRCKNCGKIYSFSSQKGTTVLIYHKCGKKPITCAASNKQKTEVLIEASKFCIADVQPFCIVDGSGFLSFCQSLLSIQSKSKSMLDARKLVPHSSLIEKKTHEIAKETRKTTVELVKSVDVSEVGLAFTIELLADKTNRVSKIYSKIR